MRQTTRTHRRPGRDSTTRLSAGGSSSAGRHASSTGQRPARTAPAATVNHIIGGAVLVLLGLGWAVGLAMTSAGPGAVDRQMLVKLVPWLLVMVGLGLTVYGFARFNTSSR